MIIIEIVKTLKIFKNKHEFSQYRKYYLKITNHRVCVRVARQNKVKHFHSRHNCHNIYICVCEMFKKIYKVLFNYYKVIF